MESFAQAVGADAIGLINLIVAAAQNATMHRKNCEQVAGHVRMIGNLLEKLKLTYLRSFPATGEPLDGLEEALRKALDMVESCREKSYLYVLAMGWTVVYQFREIQDEIDRYLKLVPLISVVHEYQIQNLKESLQAIEDDHREYTLDEEEMEAQSVILKRDRTKRDAIILEKSLSRQYPELKFREALQEEKEKLHVELQKSQVKNDIKQCCVIEHLIEVTEHVVNAPPEKNLSLNADAQYVTASKSSHGASGLQSEDQAKSEWQADLFDCCAEPCLSVFLKHFLLSNP
ncbi:hypothetical protein F0562_031547 [Nyssa sinensis]|uniref:MCAfunc domain-containing protein n=1 Tax=Nyssa sinensis TaxID=561372 RepID=A0A5J5AU83_9ASTE|nr:hypothetical protein F0562_031547 [Nyssa sinensis]